MGPEEDYVVLKVNNEYLKCSFCRTKFTKTVKLIPECGSSICGTCHDQLLAQVKNSKCYMCKECKVTHMMPAASNGLADNKVLIQLIALKSEPRMDKLAIYKAFQDEIQAKIEKMKSFDAETAVGAYCDDLVKQVMAGIEEAFNHLNKVGNGLLEKINEYRNGLLAEPVTPAPKRFKSDDADLNGHTAAADKRGQETTTTATAAEKDGGKAELARLAEEINEYGKTLALVRSGLSNDRSIDLLELRIKRYEFRYLCLESKLKDEVFKGRYMKFKPNPGFCSPDNLLGEMIFDEQPAENGGHLDEGNTLATASADNGFSDHAVADYATSTATASNGGSAVGHDELANDHGSALDHDIDENGMVKDEMADIDADGNWSEPDVATKEEATEPVVHDRIRPRKRDINSEELLFHDRVGLNMKAHRFCIRQVKVLSDGNIASCSDDHYIKIWRPNEEKMIHEFRDRAPVFTIAELSHGLLASGSRDKYISIWDLKTCQLVRSLKGHELGVFALLVLPNGNLASGSWDNSVKIWDPYATDFNLLVTIRGHGARFTNNFSITPDGYIVACSTNKASKLNSTNYSNINMVRIWNQRGELMRSFSTKSIDASSLLALRDGRIVVGFLSGRLSIYDLDRTDRPYFINKIHYGAVLALLETSDGFLLTGGSARDARVKVWNIKNWSLIQVIETGHSHNICSISLSRDQKYFATCSYDCKLKTFY